MRGAPPAYQAAIDYLYSFVNYESKMPPSPQHARFNLDRMRALLAALDDPQRHYPSVVIAGTKGKGSTCALLEAILRAAGYRTALYTSPHLHSFRERIQIDRRLIPQDVFVAYVERLKPIVAQLVSAPTFFELATTLALWYFAEQRVDVAVLEIGLGGRYDSVNVVTPRVSAITPVSFDHMAVLGNTIEEITWNKAGIIKPGVPVAIAPQRPAAEAVIRQEAAALGAPLWRADAEGAHALTDASGELWRYPVPINAETVALGGAHQLINARLAVTIALLLRAQGWTLPDAALATGLRTAHWPGRFEIIGRDPLIVVDGAMNEESALRLRDALHTLLYRRLILVLGTSRDKDIGGIARALVPEAAAVVLTRSYHPRAAPVELLEQHVRPWLPPHAPLIATHDVPPALEAARRVAGPEDCICVTGSLFPVAAAREALGVATEID
ncbi:bifunctional folylpolyglutamate synthase/dihydrofolate synthase [Kallotenue papyrolyticum]|uniref:bifunctional folylpolyglutamate synthase/dihydrofolate synthase n=1 Tax=Kallotenue papyrolyticum TaxID=1325125 RepID=UPI000492736B|nr:folylpolyglutamate synthase/dihydrofolate synthase family protein [Kallotenue papyrolyticum]